MSSGFWQTKRQMEHFERGSTLTEKIEAYTKRWEARCYSDGIPDEVPRKLEQSGRLPSYRAIAMCILRNDLQLRGIGFSGEESQLVKDLRSIKKESESPQKKLI
jgi:predicted phosphoadenosine phosphosulfate sulfurtransferase